MKKPVPVKPPEVGVGVGVGVGVVPLEEQKEQNDNISTNNGRPSAQPTAQPTGQPSSQPSSQPTGQPSSQLSSQPTANGFASFSRNPNVVGDSYPGGETDMKEQVPVKPPQGYYDAAVARSLTNDGSSISSLSISKDELNKMQPNPAPAQSGPPREPGSASFNNLLMSGGKSRHYNSTTTATSGMNRFFNIKDTIVSKTNKIRQDLEQISGSSTGTTAGTGTGRGTGRGTGSGDKLPSVDNIQRFVGLTMGPNGNGLNIEYIDNNGDRKKREVDFNNADFMSQLSNLVSALTEKGNTSAPSNLFDEATSGKNSNISLFGGDESEEQLRAQANFHHESAILAQQKIDVIRQTNRMKYMEAAKANPKIN